MSTPPKRKVKDVQVGENTVEKVLDLLNTSALLLGRSNVLSANIRTTLETYRSDMLNESNMAVTYFPSSPFIRHRDKGTAFITFIGYWMGQARELRRLFKDGKYKKSAWDTLHISAELLKQVATVGLDGIDIYFDEKRQEYSVRMR